MTEISIGDGVLAMVRVDLPPESADFYKLAGVEFLYHSVVLNIISVEDSSISATGDLGAALGEAVLEARATNSEDSIILSDLKMHTSDGRELSVAGAYYLGAPWDASKGEPEHGLLPGMRCRIEGAFSRVSGLVEQVFAEAAVRLGALFASPVISESERASAVVEGLDGVLVDILDDSTCDVFSRILGDLREAFEADAHDSHNCILDVAAEWRGFRPRWPWNPTRFFVGDPDAALVDGEFDYAVYADVVEKQLIDMTPTLEDMIDKYNGEIVSETWKYGSFAAHTYTPASPADFSLTERVAMFQKFVDEQMDRVWWSEYREESGQYESSRLLDKMYRELKAAYRLEK